MKNVPMWLRDMFLAVLMCAAVFLVYEMMSAGKAGGTFWRVGYALLADVNDVKLVTFTLLGVIMGVLATRVRSLF